MCKFRVFRLKFLEISLGTTKNLKFYAWFPLLTLPRAEKPRCKLRHYHCHPSMWFFQQPVTSTNIYWAIHYHPSTSKFNLNKHRKPKKSNLLYLIQLKIINLTVVKKNIFFVNFIGKQINMEPQNKHNFMWTIFECKTYFILRLPIYFRINMTVGRNRKYLL